MLICIPSRDEGTLGAPVSSHFGRAPNYTLFDDEADGFNVTENNGKHHGGQRSPPEIIAETGADVLVVGNLGRKAVDRFDQMDIKVYCGAEGTVSDAIAQYEAGELEAATPSGSYCEGHGHEHGDDHDRGDGHGHSHGHDHAATGDDHAHGHDDGA
ncbi:NifB/NifX family molybdenum-iron cluster-binding protein [Halorhabdus rudnickae]|uniref:NifB/NifX family molybdenum-iron cluster-binding protein n=1 Tax=Halorhabdus rudnickae TaxID=1775544 RepID=UPI0014383EB4|nr:NifB/NifX family molybdenum-iron cluster-binding protein [Halorhabdus rudnickae]